MLSRCLVCHSEFPKNESLEYMPNGRRIAFDPARGRLWTVCKSCRRWSLAPIEERWEALEELEKLTVDRARLLSKTDNIALLEAGELEIVRVGQAKLREEAWWRYGRELAERRSRYKKISVAGTVAVGAALVGGWTTGGIGLIGTWFLWEHAPGKVGDAARWLRYGSSAWRGNRTCEKCGHEFRSVPFRERGGLILRPGEAGDEDFGLTLQCPRCRSYRDGGLHIEGAESLKTLRRTLAYHHFSGASDRLVGSATRLIEEAGTTRDLTRIIVKDGRRLSSLQRTGAIALEIAANESAEQKMLEWELAELEEHWREEEELASIIDGELTPLPFIESIRQKLMS